MDIENFLLPMKLCLQGISFFSSADLKKKFFLRAVVFFFLPSYEQIVLRIFFCPLLLGSQRKGLSYLG